jgi:hypothetical protein
MRGWCRLLHDRPCRRDVFFDRNRVGRPSRVTRRASQLVMTQRDCNGSIEPGPGPAGRSRECPADDAAPVERTARLHFLSRVGHAFDLYRAPVEAHVGSLPNCTVRANGSCQEAATAFVSAPRVGYVARLTQPPAKRAFYRIIRAMAANVLAHPNCAVYGPDKPALNGSNLRPRRNRRGIAGTGHDHGVAAGGRA